MFFFFRKAHVLALCSEDNAPILKTETLVFFAFKTRLMLAKYVLFLSKSSRQSGNMCTKYVMFACEKLIWVLSAVRKRRRSRSLSVSLQGRWSRSSTLSTVRGRRVSRRVPSARKSLSRGTSSRSKVGWRPGTVRLLFFEAPAPPRFSSLFV
jgi:hypothetical protein